MKLTTILVFVAVAAGASVASNLGSVVNSWDAGYIDQHVYYSPLGVEYAAGYVWVPYGTFYAQRVPKTGSIVIPGGSPTSENVSGS